MKERIITILIFFAIVATSLYFGFHRLQNFSGVDEPLWSYDRVPRFWEVVKEGKWKKTALCDKPGVTLDAVSGIGLLGIKGNPKKMADWRYQAKTPEQLQTLEDLYFKLRFPVYLFTLAMLPVFYWLIKRLLGKNIARFSILFIGLSPVLLGISLMINTDALLWSLLPLTLLSFLVYQKENKRKFLYLSGFLLGLTLLDKYIGNILFPFFFGLIFLKYILDDEVPRAAAYFKKALIDFGILILVCAVTIAALFPAVWVRSKMLLDVTIYSKAFHKTWPVFFILIALAAIDAFFLKSLVSGNLCDWIRARKRWLTRGILAVVFLLIVFVLANTYLGMKFFDFQAVFNFPSLELKNINLRFGEPLVIMLSSFFPLLFALVPAAAALFLFAAIEAGRSRLKKGEALYVLYFLIFILFYYAGSAVSGVAPTVRYQIVLYPLAAIIAAIGLGYLISLKSLKKYISFSSTASFFVLLLVLFVISTYSLKSVKPFYLSYASDLLPKRYVLDLRNMGDGSWEAAEYLNSLPDAKISKCGRTGEVFVRRLSELARTVSGKASSKTNMTISLSARDGKKICSKRRGKLGKVERLY